ncbi:MAG TPA: IPTL-CTERM sorting domain-containing protein [Thermodesulfobacteriota bacterium]|nr:IPTL-CTERM sorting domain-containing protein [Thermodesulfobacteriota bacterium]
MNKTITAALFLLSILFLGLPAASEAQPVLNPENGHYYECVPCGRNWTQANQYAYSLTFDDLRGHLATITTPEENAFIAGLGCGLSWLGGFQSPSATQPDQGWLWITGEPFIYTAWAPGEPSGDCVGNDCNSCLEFSGELGGWNDLPCPNVRECIVEYEMEVSAIPTLSEWGMIAAAAGFALVGMFYAMRKRRASA